MSDDELCYLPATEAIARFKAKTLSPVELMQANSIAQQLSRGNLGGETACDSLSRPFPSFSA